MRDLTEIGNTAPNGPADVRGRQAWKIGKLAIGVVAAVGGLVLILSNARGSGGGERMASIFDAVALGDVEAVRSQTRWQACTREVDLEGNTPLHRAIRANQLAVAKVLLEAGAQVDAKNSGGYTPLDLAVLVREWDTTEAVRLLLDADATLDARLPNGEPLVHTAIASRRDDDPLLALLLSKAPRSALEARNSKRQTALDVAVESGSVRVAERIRGALASR